MYWFHDFWRLAFHESWSNELLPVQSVYIIAFSHDGGTIHTTSQRFPSWFLCPLLLSLCVTSCLPCYLVRPLHLVMLFPECAPVELPYSTFLCPYWFASSSSLPPLPSGWVTVRWSTLQLLWVLRGGLSGHFRAVASSRKHIASERPQCLCQARSLTWIMFRWLTSCHAAYWATSFHLLLPRFELHCHRFDSPMFDTARGHCPRIGWLIRYWMLTTMMTWVAFSNNYKLSTVNDNWGSHQTTN